MGNTISKCVKTVWRGVKSVAKGVWKVTKYVTKGVYRTCKIIYKTGKCIIRKAYNGMKWIYNKSKGMIEKVKQYYIKAKNWVWDKVKQCGSWIRTKLQNTWIGRGVLKIWDFGCDCVQWVKDKYNKANNWLRENVPIIGSMLADGMDWMKDQALSYVTGGLSFVNNACVFVYDKIKDTKVVRFINDVDDLCMDKLDRFEKKCIDKFNKIKESVEPYLDTANEYWEKGNALLDDAYHKVDKYLDDKYDELCGCVPYERISDINLNESLIGHNILNENSFEQYNFDTMNIDQCILNQRKPDQVNAVCDIYKDLLFRNETDILNFGGSLVLAVKNYKNNANSKLASYRDLGFDILRDVHPEYNDSLVKLVRDKDVTVHSCKAKTSGGDPYCTELDIENNLEHKVDCLIPAGSVIAEQNEFRTVQNLCSQKDYGVLLEPKQRKIFNINSFCMDLDFKCPSGENANFTPLIYRNMPMNIDQSAFWRWSDQFRKYENTFDD